MHIAFCLDNGYVPYCSVVMASVIESNKGEEITFHLLGDGITEENERRLKAWIRGFEDVHLKLYRIDKADFKSFPIGDGYVNISTYFRLMIPSLLGNLDKIIYLDCDVVVASSLNELWNTDMGDFALAGVRDRINDYVRVYNRLGYPMEDGYVNAGVLLINLKRWREDNVFQKAMDIAQNMPLRLKNHDQDIINLLYHGRVLMLDFKYNLLEYYLYTEDWLYMDRKYYPQIERACLEPVIVHFCMPQKPWHYECINPYQETFLKYMRMTPWADLPLTHKVQKLTKKEKLKLFLERIGVYKVERKSTLRRDMNRIEDVDNILF